VELLPVPSTACLATSSTAQPAARRYLAMPTVDTKRSRQASMEGATSVAMLTRNLALMPGRLDRRACPVPGYAGTGQGNARRAGRHAAGVGP
jgi:hypothetical protein